MVSDSDLVARLREVLRDSDLEKATAGSVRRQLEEDFGVDFSDRKSFIREQIDIYLGEVGGADEDDGNVKAENEPGDAAEEEEEKAEEEEGEEEGTEGKGSRKRRWVIGASAVVIIFHCFWFFLVSAWVIDQVHALFSWFLLQFQFIEVTDMAFFTLTGTNIAAQPVKLSNFCMSNFARTLVIWSVCLRIKKAFPHFRSSAESPKVCGFDEKLTDRKFKIYFFSFSKS